MFDENDEQNGEADSKTFFNITKKSKVVNNYEIYLNQSITMSPNLYVLLDMFRSASKNDSIKVHLNSPGGRLDTTISILNAMEDCKAEITMVADGRVASACTFLFLAGDKHEIRGFAYFMFHQYSGSASGKGGDIREKVEFTYSHYEKFFKHYYGELFEEERIQELLNGKDKYMEKSEMEMLLNKIKGNKVEESPIFGGTSLEEISKMNKDSIDKSKKK